MTDLCREQINVLHQTFSFFFKRRNDRRRTEKQTGEREAGGGRVEGEVIGGLEG